MQFTTQHNALNHETLLIFDTDIYYDISQYLYYVISIRTDIDVI